MFRTYGITLLALLAFAANSLLCRMALSMGEQDQHAIDPASFTLIRLSAGAAFLAVLSPRLTGLSLNRVVALGSWQAAFYLFAYAAGFSFAYLSLDTGTGALILFGSVQISMFAINVWRGVSVSKGEWFGMLVAMSGLAFMLLPGASAPSPIGFLLMAAAGLAWGLYSLAGLGQANAIANTTANFLKSLVYLPVLMLLVLGQSHWTTTGVWLAVASGTLASGAGYCLWYIALERLKPTQAAVSQLSVPVIAALLGVILLAERPTQPLVVGASLVLAGLAIALRLKHKS